VFAFPDLEMALWLVDGLDWFRDFPERTDEGKESISDSKGLYVAVPGVFIGLSTDVSRRRVSREALG
jgi:hypothetical protein